MDKPTWTVIPENSSVYATVSSVKGTFHSYEANVEVDPESIVTSNISFMVDLSSIDTGHKELDAHLLSEHFFEVEKFPDVRFIANNILEQDDHRYELVGDFSLHGVMRTESFFVTLEPGSGKTAQLRAKAVIKRSDYGLTLDDAFQKAGAPIEDEVNILLDLHLVKTA